MAPQQQQPPMDPPFKNHVYYVPEGCLWVNMRHLKKKKKLSYLSGAILLKPSKRKKQSWQKEKAHEQQLPSQHWASSKIRLFTHLARYCLKFV